METNLEIIRKECIKSNPSILDLKFGCEAEDENGIWIKNTLGWGQKDKPDNFSAMVPDKVLGRPIHLADILLALSLNHMNQYHDSMNKINDEILASLIEMYNLRNDDLTAQTPECISFLADLLAQK